MDAGEELSRIEECLWVIQAQHQDRIAFRRLVERYERRILYYLCRQLGNADSALDALQDVWLIVLRQLSALRRPEAFRVWVYKIAHGRSVTLLNRKRLEAEAREELTADPAESETGDELEMLERAELVHRALDQVAPLHREVLTLRFLEGLRLDEIAEIIGCSLGTVKSRLHYAKRAMELLLKELRDE